MDAIRLPTKGSDMSRRPLLAAFAALLAAAATARAEEPKKEVPAVDPTVQAAIRAAVEKAKQELRDEMKVEAQNAQAAAEFMGTVAEGPKLQFLELDGSFRLRGDLFDALGLHRGLDTNGQYLFPRPGISNPDGRGTQTGANLRLQLAPTLNVSEHVRVRAEIGILENYVLGNSGASPWSGATPSDRAAVEVKRAWGEVETPVGLISFGRMPAAFGLGLVNGNFDGLDDDWSDSKDRLQLAVLPVSTPVGPLSTVLSYDFDTTGPQQANWRQGAGTGQPFTLDPKADGRSWNLKVMRLDTEDEIRRKLEQGVASLNWGAVYAYSTQAWAKNPNFGVTDAVRTADAYVHRKEYRHQLDLWFRYKTTRLLVEAEATGLAGRIGDPGPFSAGLDYPASAASGPSPVGLLQAGGAARVAWEAMPRKLSLGGELGVASGDKAPGFGNAVGQLAADGSLPTYGALEGPQYGLNGDHSIDNLRFNPGYRVDLILWREILGQVTDAWYLKPSLKWEVVSGLTYTGALVYSQAIYASSTPSATSAGSGRRPLGLEVDNSLAYASDDGFHAWLNYGVLFPLDGLHGGGATLTRAHAVRAGLAIKF
jgi:uncharacterized protein (TIGR04551 family)